MSEEHIYPDKRILCGTPGAPLCDYHREWREKRAAKEAALIKKYRQPPDDEEMAQKYQTKFGILTMAEIMKRCEGKTKAEIDEFWKVEKKCQTCGDDLVGDHYDC